MSADNQKSLTLPAGGGGGRRDSASKRGRSEVEPDIQDEIEIISEKLQKNEDVQIIELLKNIFLMTKEMKDNQNDLQLSVRSLERKTDKTDERVDNLEKAVTKLEFENVSSSVIIRGLPMHSNAVNRSETFDETTEVVKTFLKAMKIESSLNLIEASRFAASKFLIPNSLPKPPSVKVTFRNKNETQFFFVNLKNLKGSIYEKVAVSREIPQSLMKKNRELEVAGYQIRQREKDTKTKVFQSNFDLVLKKKTPESKDWEVVKVEVVRKSKGLSGPEIVEKKDP